MLFIGVDTSLMSDLCKISKICYQLKLFEDQIRNAYFEKHIIQCKIITNMERLHHCTYPHPAGGVVAGFFGWGFFRSPIIDYCGNSIVNL